MPAPIALDVSLADQAVAMAASLAADGAGGEESQDLVAAQNKAQAWCILKHAVCSSMDAHGCTNLFIPHGNVCASHWWVLMQVIKASQGLKRPAGDTEDDAKVPKAKTAKAAAKSKARGRPKAKVDAREVPSAESGEKVSAGEVPSAPEGGETVDAGEVPSAPGGEVPKKKTSGPRQKTSPEVLSAVWAGKVGSSGVVSSIEFDIGVSFSLLFSPPCLDVLVFQLFQCIFFEVLVNVDGVLLSAWCVLFTSHGCWISLMRSNSKILFEYWSFMLFIPLHIPKCFAFARSLCWRLPAFRSPMATSPLRKASLWVQLPPKMEPMRSKFCPALNDWCSWSFGWSFNYYVDRCNDLNKNPKNNFMVYWLFNYYVDSFDYVDKTNPKNQYGVFTCFWCTLFFDSTYQQIYHTVILRGICDTSLSSYSWTIYYTNHSGQGSVFPMRQGPTILHWPS